MSYTKAIYDLSKRQVDQSARDLPVKCFSARRPAGIDDPRRPGFMIAFRKCVDCGADTWASKALGRGWYVSPFCHTCLNDSATDYFKSKVTFDVRANLRQRHHNAGLTDRDIDTHFDLDHVFKRFDGDLWCAFLVGLPGTGKTTQLVEAIKYHVGGGLRCRYLVEGDLCRLLRPDGGLKIEDLLELDLLCLDEFGSDGRTEWGVSQIKAVIDGRYRERKPTILSSNHSLKTIAKRPGLGRPVAERIFEGLGGREGMRRVNSKYRQYRFSYRIGKTVGLPDGCPIIEVQEVES
jgi:hypothetical protein